MGKDLKFYFDKNDPKFISNTVIVNNTLGNYISQVFVKCPIYKKYNCGNVKQIGYKVADDYVQQLDIDKYLIRINSTYYFENSGTISWQYSFINNVPEVYYPINKNVTSNIISTTGCYLLKKGYVNLLACEDGIRKVKIMFNTTNNFDINHYGINNYGSNHYGSNHYDTNHCSRNHYDKICNC